MDDKQPIGYEDYLREKLNELVNENCDRESIADFFSFLVDAFQEKEEGQPFKVKFYGYPGLTIEIYSDDYVEDNLD
jgi:hypothetical protein